MFRTALMLTVLFTLPATSNADHLSGFGYDLGDDCPSGYGDRDNDYRRVNYTRDFSRRGGDYARNDRFDDYRRPTIRRSRGLSDRNLGPANCSEFDTNFRNNQNYRDRTPSRFPNLNSDTRNDYEWNQFLRGQSLRNQPRRDVAPRDFGSRNFTTPNLNRPDLNRNNLDLSRNQFDPRYNGPQLNVPRNDYRNEYNNDFRNNDIYRNQLTTPQQPGNIQTSPFYDYPQNFNNAPVPQNNFFAPARP